MHTRVWCGSPSPTPHCWSLIKGVTRHLPTAERRASSWREQKDLLKKRLTHSLYQTPGNPMAPVFHHFHCSQDNLFNICFSAAPGGQQIQEFFVQGNAWIQIPSPKSFQLTVQQPKALPVTSWTLGMLPLLSARARISSPVAPEGHSFPTHQHDCFVRKTHVSKWVGTTEKPSKVARKNQSL